MTRSFGETEKNVPNFGVGRFHRLLADAGKEHGWTLIAEQEKKVAGKTIRPDGTFKDQMNLVRGFWEAKDTADTKKRHSAFNSTAGVVK